MCPSTRDLLIVEQNPSLEQWKQIDELCCRTGNGGEPIARERWNFFSHVWVSPYQRLRPSWTYFMQAPGVGVVGYLTGCPDTSSYYTDYRLKVLPGLILEALIRAPREKDARNFLRRLLRVDPTPESSFQSGLRLRLKKEFPAHLHINFDPAYRGRGAGAELIEAYCEDLKRQGVTGLHLFCGKGPLGFYFRAGFIELAKVEFRPGVWVYALGKKIA